VVSRILYEGKVTQPAIRVDKLSKQYCLGHNAQWGRTFREMLVDVAKAPLRRLRGFGGPRQELFWALHEVSLEVQPGEVVGIIGRNGAGKSTLLKILSRITEPTSGRAELGGRVASLLEVGTGFHPELTGRENIFLNGALLGMKRVEVKRKFDAIVEFAEVEKFLDTAVKHYSSGMYVRLAFAVAAHLQQEILLVDEVLAVGDTSFQKKCLGKMESVANEGRTVLFVSHHMPTVTRVCPRTILLDRGGLAFDGESHEAVSVYLASGLGVTAAREWSNLDAAPGDHVVRLLSVRARQPDGAIGDAFDIRRPIAIEMEYQVRESGHVLCPNLHLFNEEGINLFAAVDQDAYWRYEPRAVGRYVSTAWVPGNFFADGVVLVLAAMSSWRTRTWHFSEREVIAFHVIDSLDGDSARGDYIGPMPGVVRPMLKWETRVVAMARSGDLTSSLRRDMLC
jgi:lipopolysaccharide transport system ATP-binding protein